MLLLDMAAAGHGERVALQHANEALTYEELLRAAWTVPTLYPDAKHLAYVGTNGLAFPIALFGATAANIPFIPLNYRLPDEQLHNLLSHHEDLVVIADAGIGDRLAALGHRVVPRDEFVAAARAGTETGEPGVDGDEVALLLYTSGTTAAPKAAMLRHRHLTSYVFGSVEFGGAEPTDAVLVSVPPYHIAGVANLLSNTFLGRRIVYLDRFDAEGWLDTVRTEKITHAMVVPTMLARIADFLHHADTADAPSLKALSYGGARTPLSVVERIMQLFPDAGLTNAYGLTETSSTIAVLGPEDHREAFASDDEHIRARLSSAGKILPSIEIEVRDEHGVTLAAGEVGDIFVRGDQVSGEYQGLKSAVDADGWFPTRDRGWVDDGGFLFVEGRSDDTIIRGGENIAPAEVEEAVLRHPGVADCAVVGVPDDEWGHVIAAMVVRAEDSTVDADEVREFVRSHLRGSKTPDVVAFVDALPYTDTGKLVRRHVLVELIELIESGKL